MPFQSLHFRYVSLPLFCSPHRWSYFKDSGNMIMYSYVSKCGGAKKIIPIFFRSLDCDRLRVHKNFMMALIIRYIVSVVYYEPYIYGDPDRIIWFRDIGQVSLHIYNLILRRLFSKLKFYSYQKFKQRLRDHTYIT